MHNVLANEGDKNKVFYILLDMLIGNFEILKSSASNGAPELQETFVLVMTCQLLIVSQKNGNRITITADNIENYQNEVIKNLSAYLTPLTISQLRAGSLSTEDAKVKIDKTQLEAALTAKLLELKKTYISQKDRNLYVRCLSNGVLNVEQSRTYLPIFFGSLSLILVRKASPSPSS
jgi:hypothetical protein